MLAFLSQPVATLIAASLVLTGVIVTLRHNARQLIRTQLRRAVDERLKALQDEYSNFAGACFDLLSNYREIILWKKHLAELPATVYIEPGKSLELPERDTANENIAILHQQQGAIRARIMTAQAKLLLLDSDQARGNQIHDFWREISKAEVLPLKRLNEMTVDIRLFMEVLSFELGQEYLYWLARAQKGLPPLPPNPFIRQKGVPERQEDDDHDSVTQPSAV